MWAVDDVPDEISSIIRQNTDVGIIDEETGGYVPIDDEEVVDDRDVGDMNVIEGDRGDIEREPGEFERILNVCNRKDPLMLISTRFQLTS